MKVDLVMWTKNGERTLPCVLDRINQVIPNDMINRRFIIDDRSIDRTCEIADLFGWKVIANEGTGISDGANTALKNVESEAFCSFEQDLLLARDWWNIIPQRLGDEKVAVVSGMRFADRPIPLMKLQKYVALKYRGEKYLSSYLKSRELSAFTLGKTLDNTIYRTSVIRDVGGFPKIGTNAGVDTALAYRLEKRGFIWAVDYSVQSVHLRKDLGEELNHQFWHGQQQRNMWFGVKKYTGVTVPVNFKSIVSRLFIAPFTGLFVALKMHDARIVIVHPLVRFYYAWGFLKGERRM
jgi:glycosyltransferase involved in cell wall biosynthesis